ncbi:MAG: hypothetical protein ABI779_15180 [Acidobacteriota bacterium]
MAISSGDDLKHAAIFSGPQHPQVPNAPRVALAMRTTDRRRCVMPATENYVRATVAALVQQGVTDWHLQLSKRADAEWVGHELGDLCARLRVRVPEHDLSPNATALAALGAVDLDTADWVLLLEDDLAFCRDFVPSVRRWLGHHAMTTRNVYRFFGFHAPVSKHAPAFEHSLDNLCGSQTIALRCEDARDFVAWGVANLATWREPAQADPGMAFDKFVAAWALGRWSGRPGMLSWPFFVDHVGVESSLHKVTGLAMNHQAFAGSHWAYEPGL